MTGALSIDGGVARSLVLRELSAWAAAGRRPMMWWRDDDARTATPELGRLLQIAEDFPVSIAVIPDGDLAELGALLARPSVTISQHGVDHVRRSEAKTSPSEYAAATSAETRADLIAAARERLCAHGLEPLFFTPPWNQVDELSSAAIAKAGFRYISAWGEPPGQRFGLLRLDANLDPIFWRFGAHFRGHAAIYGRLALLLGQRRRAGAWRDPIGFVTHHEKLSPRGWRFVESFLEFTRHRFDWVPFAQAAELCAETTPSTAARPTARVPASRAAL